MSVLCNAHSDGTLGWSFVPLLEWSWIRHRVPRRLRGTRGQQMLKLVRNMSRRDSNSQPGSAEHHPPASRAPGTIRCGGRCVRSTSTIPARRCASEDTDPRDLWWIGQEHPSIAQFLGRRPAAHLARQEIWIGEKLRSRSAWQRLHPKRTRLRNRKRPPSGSLLIGVLIGFPCATGHHLDWPLREPLSAENRSLVGRAFPIANREPAGPVYVAR